MDLQLMLVFISIKNFTTLIMEKFSILMKAFICPFSAGNGKK
jgi:hypothetical protein